MENKILRGLKSKSNNLWWDGKPEMLLAFLQNLEEWVHIKFGDIAMRVLSGHHTKVDGTPIPPFMYTTWSTELYLMVLGLVGKLRWLGHEGWDRLVAGLLEILGRTSKGFDQGRSEGIGVVGNRR